MKTKDPYEMSNDALIMEFKELVIKENQNHLTDDETYRLDSISDVIHMRMNEGIEHLDLEGDEDE
jgi:hypothetical protein